MMFKVVVILAVASAAFGAAVRKHPSHNLRIVGGNETTIDQYPWQVAIEMLGLEVCGGSIIGPDTILTAAHCIDTIMMPFIYNIVAGTTNLLEPAQSVKIAEAYAHPNFTVVDWDVGIIKLAEPLNFSDTVQAVKLPESGTPVEAGTPVTVTGWGVTSEGGIIPPAVLRYVDVEVVDHEECAENYSGFEEYQITDHMICAGVSGGGKDACQGDSGGPLTTKDGVLVGIVSWGMGCGEPNYPGVYTNVASLRDWIKENTGI